MSVRRDSQQWTKRAVPCLTGNMVASNDWSVALESVSAVLHCAARVDVMDVVILRPQLLYGPRVKVNILKLIQWVDKGIPLPLGGVKNKRSLLSLSNFADVISKCLVDPGAGGQTFTVCDGDDVSSGELLERIAKALGKSPRLLPVPESLLKFGGKLTGKSEQVQRLCSSLQVDSS